VVRAAGGLAVVCFFTLASSPASALWPFSRSSPALGDDLTGAAADLLSRAIQIDTTNPPGNEAPLARLFVDIAKREGLEAQLIETPSAGSEIGRAAAWARLPGRGQRRPIVLLSHLDVVPADGEGWVVDPFSGLITAGYVVGRGALDAKGVSVVHLLALAAARHQTGPRCHLPGDAGRGVWRTPRRRLAGEA